MVIVLIRVDLKFSQTSEFRYSGHILKVGQYRVWRRSIEGLPHVFSLMVLMGIFDLFYI